MASKGWFALLSGALVVCMAVPAFAAKISNACIPRAVQSKLESCPPGPGKARASQRGAPSVRQAAGANKPAKSTKPPEPEAPTLPERKHVLAPRQTALLVREIRGLERLLGQTPPKSPDRPQLLRRLAEGYVELEASARRGKGKRAARIVEAARKNAIKTYRSFATAYPNDPKIDEVLYYMAYEHELGGDHAGARKVYYELLRKAPTSPWVPRAYLAFGELFFQEAQGDPDKWELAAQAYREVLKYPPPDNKAHGYARYKLAYVHWNREELPEALDQLKKTIVFGTQFPSLPGAAALAKSARRDAVTVYAASGSPERAYGFFEPLTGARTLELLDELGIAYIDIGRYREAITLYRELVRRDAGARECHYQAQITTATQAAKSGDKPAIHREISQLVALRNGFVNGDASDALKQTCSNRTAEIAAETAMMWHLEAVGSGGVRGTNDDRTKDLAADLYRRVVASFTAKEFEKLRFPRIVRADWPTLPRIAYALADLEYSRGRWAECARAFDSVVEQDPRGPDAAAAAFAAVVCYQKLYESRHASGSDRRGRGLALAEASTTEWQRLAPRALEDDERRMLSAMDRYLCWIEIPKGDHAARAQRVDVEFARARTFYEAQHWEEAALAFRKIALEHPTHEAAVFAAHLYLESLNVLASHAEPPRAACIDDLARDVPTFARSFCTDPKTDEERTQCDVLVRVGVDVERKRIEKLVARADALAKSGDSASARPLYTRAGDAYLALWRGHCEKPLAGGQRPKACERADEILHNMARAFQAAHLLAKAMQARQTLLDPRYGLHESALALEATYELGKNNQAIAVYDRAAERYEHYVEATCKKQRRCGEHASAALSDAVVLRLGLGQPERALESAQAFQRWFGKKHRAEAAHVAFAVAAHFGEAKDWKQAAQRSRAAMKLIDEGATLDVRIQAHALLGRAENELGRRRAAETEYEAVLRLWSDPKAATAAIQRLPGDSARRLGRALDAVGEAHFFFAEQKRQAVLAVRFPAYRGPGTKAAVLAHIHGKVADWIAKKRPLIETATAEYEKIMALSPTPPRWAIAAGARVGEMWGGFVDEFRAAPIPDSINNDRELRNAYYAAIDQASEPQKLFAKRAHQTCLGHSARYQYWDEHSRSCETWLARHYKADYHVVDEFRGAATRHNSALRERVRPLRLPPIASNCERSRKGCSRSRP